MNSQRSPGVLNPESSAPRLPHPTPSGLRSTDGILAVVLISRNQRWNIQRLITSVQRAVAAIPSTDVVLVDSASTDDTVQLAIDYPIRILRLRSNQRLTAAGGRYVGYMHTAAEFVLFLDGDMELYPGWLDCAIRLLETRPDVAVVTGTVINLPPDTPGPASTSNHPSGPSAVTAEAVEVAHGGGAALYRRSVLERVGTFNPYLYSDEEPELCLRIRAAGYRVVCLEHPIAHHYSADSGVVSTLLARRQRRLYFGSGQVIRQWLGTPLLWQYLRERGLYCAPAVWLALGAAGLLWALGRGAWFALESWIVLSMVLFVGGALHKRSISHAFFAVVHRVIQVDGTLRGFFLKPLDPQSHPLRVDAIK